MRYVFQIVHDEETYLYSAESAYEARRFHDELNVKPSLGHEPAMSALPELSEFHQVDDDKQISVMDAGPKGETITMTAREWAAQDCGLVSTTAGY